MGHSYVEMFPKEIEEQNRKWARINRLQKALNQMPLSAFSVKELGRLLNVLGLEKDNQGLKREADDENIKYFKKKFKTIRKSKI